MRRRELTGRRCGAHTTGCACAARRADAVREKKEGRTSSRRWRRTDFRNALGCCTLLLLIEKRPARRPTIMAISPGVIAFTVILVLYITVGVFAAIGTAYVSKALLPPKFEQVFYAVYLVMIAGFYLAFTVYFGSDQAWRVESTAVLCFALIALAGIRAPYALIAGYLLHGM